MPRQPKTTAAAQAQAQTQQGKSGTGNTSTPKNGRVRRSGERATPDERAAEQEKFLEAYSSGLSITASCKAAGVNRSAYYDWQEHDEAFSLRCQQAKQAGDDVLRDEIRRRAVEGWDEEVYQLGKYAGTVRRYSDTLLIFQAKARMPEYRDKVQVSATVQGSVSHDHTFQDDPEAAALARALIRRATASSIPDASGTRVPSE